MKTIEIKKQLDINNIKSLVHWKKYMRGKMEYVLDEYNQKDFDEFMDLYDFIVSQICDWAIENVIDKGE